MYVHRLMLFICDVDYKKIVKFSRCNKGTNVLKTSFNVFIFIIH